MRAYRDSMETDTGRLDAIEDRLTLIRDMQRKYRGSVDQILERAQAAEAEIERLSKSEEHLAELEQQEQTLLTMLGKLALQLSEQRANVAVALAKAIVGAMRDLAMPHVRFEVSMLRDEARDGVPLPGFETVRYAFDKMCIRDRLS